MQIIEGGGARKGNVWRDAMMMARRCSYRGQNYMPRGGVEQNWSLMLPLSNPMVRKINTMWPIELENQRCSKGVGLVYCGSHNSLFRGGEILVAARS